jgi:MazG family protein
MSESPIDRLKGIIARLRQPDGCPWDQEQTPASIAPHIIEEAYELVEAIETGDSPAILDELSDQLLHVVMISQMMTESNTFTFDDVAQHCAEKMIRRHPHVFKDPKLLNNDALHAQWETIKDTEYQRKSKLDGVPTALPALLQAHKLQKKAAQVGIDCLTLSQTPTDLVTHCQTLCHSNPSKKTLPKVIGDVLFMVVAIGRKWGLSAEEQLKNANQRFASRFKKMETTLADHNKPFPDTSIKSLENYWDHILQLKK